MTALDYAVFFKNHHHEQLLRQAMVSQNMLPHTTSEDRNIFVEAAGEGFVFSGGSHATHSLPVTVTKPDEDADEEEARGDGDESDG